MLSHEVFHFSSLYMRDIFSSKWTIIFFLISTIKQVGFYLSWHYSWANAGIISILLMNTEWDAVDIILKPKKKWIQKIIKAKRKVWSALIVGHFLQGMRAGVWVMCPVSLVKKTAFPFPSEVSWKCLIGKGYDFVSTSFCWNFVWFEFVFVFIFHFLFCLVG